MTEPTKLNLDVKRWIQDHLEASGQTQQDFAAQCGVSSSQICRYLRGERDLYVETLGRILPVLGARVSRARGRRRKV